MRVALRIEIAVEVTTGVGALEIAKKEKKLKIAAFWRKRYMSCT